MQNSNNTTQRQIGDLSSIDLDMKREHYSFEWRWLPVYTVKQLVDKKLQKHTLSWYIIKENKQAWIDCQVELSFKYPKVASRQPGDATKE